MNFRRLITAMALLALCVGLASAQVQIGTIGGVSAGALACTASVAAPPSLRSEGITELIGDIVLTCTGGPVPVTTAGSNSVNTANITVSLGTNVTSRLLGQGTSTNPSNSSEALLLIDEPGSTLAPIVPGSGPGAAQTPCSNSASGAAIGGPCSTYAIATGTNVVASSSSTTIAAPFNVYEGLVNANQVTFNGVPIMAPSTVGIARVFRITNIRANVSGLGSSGLPGTTQLLASISISGNTALPINAPVQIAGFVNKGLTTALQATDGTSFSLSSLQQCSSASRKAVATLAFSENFATAFKTRVAAPPGTTGSNPGAQNVPGTIYNSESGFILPSVSGTTPIGGTAAEAGLADAGTRLKAVFNNLPAGVSIYVSTVNVSGGAAGSPVGKPGNTDTTPFAQLVVSETTPDSGGVIPTVPPTTTAGSSVPVAQLAIVNGSATAVWEVTNTNPALSESLSFGVYVSYTANTGSNSPTPGTATVNMSYAPTSTVTTASSTAFIPRFVDTSSASNLFSISICQTVLLYPFVTNQAGFDTGIAIANTTTDPFGTSPQAGSCAMYFYGASAPAASVNTGNIATGTVYTTLASTTAAGFQGYMIAVCNFQLAHGFAFISDLGARNLAMGYLALVLPNGTGARVATEQLNN